MRTVGVDRSRLWGCLARMWRANGHLHVACKTLSWMGERPAIDLNCNLFVELMHGFLHAFQILHVPQCSTSGAMRSTSWMMLFCIRRVHQISESISRYV